MSHLIPVSSEDDILLEYRGNPIGLLLAHHNLARPYEAYEKAQLLVSMCMDNRKSLRMPENFAYILRSGGANLRRSEFKVSYAIAIGGVLWHGQPGLEKRVICAGTRGTCLLGSRIGRRTFYALCADV
ncbi:MAG: hypothetical protein QMD04_04255 [Anaerolineales bacterium]|nr:hypothetical protein [Anaerolineales bacterium]